MDKAFCSESYSNRLLEKLFFSIKNPYSFWFISTEISETFLRRDFMILIRSSETLIARKMHFFIETRKRTWNCQSVFFGVILCCDVYIYDLFCCDDSSWDIFFNLRSCFTLFNYLVFCFCEGKTVIEDSSWWGIETSRRNQ